MRAAFFACVVLALVAAAAAAPGARFFFPSSGAEDVELTSPIAFIFAENVVAAEGNIDVSIDFDSGAQQVETIPIQSVRITNAQLVIPYLLQAGAEYTFTIPAGVLETADDGESVEQSQVTFSTVPAPPSALQLTGTTPFNGASNVPLDSAVSFTFNENIKRGSSGAVQISVFEDDAGEASEIAFDSDDLVFSGNTLTIANFEIESERAYIFRVESGVVEAVDDDEVFGPISLSFDTLDDTPVALTSSSPSQDGSLSAGSRIVLRFATPVIISGQVTNENELTITGDDGSTLFVPVAGDSVSADGNEVQVLFPQADIGVSYTVLVPQDSFFNANNINIGNEEFTLSFLVTDPNDNSIRVVSTTSQACVSF